MNKLKKEEKREACCKYALQVASVPQFVARIRIIYTYNNTSVKKLYML